MYYFALVFLPCYLSNPWGNYSEYISHFPNIYTGRQADFLDYVNYRSRLDIDYHCWCNFYLRCSLPLPCPVCRYFLIWSLFLWVTSPLRLSPSISILPSRFWSDFQYLRGKLIPVIVLAIAFFYWRVSSRASGHLGWSWRSRGALDRWTLIDRADFIHRGRCRYHSKSFHWWWCGCRLSWNRTIIGIASLLLRWLCIILCLPLTAPSNNYFMLYQYINYLHCCQGEKVRMRQRSCSKVGVQLDDSRLKSGYSSALMKSLIERKLFSSSSWRG